MGDALIKLAKIMPEKKGFKWIPDHIKIVDGAPVHVKGHYAKLPKGDFSGKDLLEAIKAGKTIGAKAPKAPSIPKGKSPEMLQIDADTSIQIPAGLSAWQVGAIEQMVKNAKAVPTIEKVGLNVHVDFPSGDYTHIILPDGQQVKSQKHMSYEDFAKSKQEQGVMPTKKLYEHAVSQGYTKLDSNDLNELDATDLAKETLAGLTANYGPPDEMEAVDGGIKVKWANVKATNEPGYKTITRHILPNGVNTATAWTGTKDPGADASELASHDLNDLDATDEAKQTASNVISKKGLPSEISASPGKGISLKWADGQGLYVMPDGISISPPDKGTVSDSTASPSWAFGPSGKMRNIKAMGMAKLKSELGDAEGYSGSKWYAKLYEEAKMRGVDVSHMTKPGSLAKAAAEFDASWDSAKAHMEGTHPLSPKVTNLVEKLPKQTIKTPGLPEVTYDTYDHQHYSQNGLTNGQMQEIALKMTKIPKVDGIGKIQWSAYPAIGAQLEKGGLPTLLRGDGSGGVYMLYEDELGKAAIHIDKQGAKFYSEHASGVNDEGLQAFMEEWDVQALGSYTVMDKPAEPESQHIAVKIQKFADRLAHEINNDSKFYTSDLDKKVQVTKGKKYTKVDVGGSGKYMVEHETGAIYGIKAYGVIHKGHYYGTVDTIDDYDWSGYTGVKKNKDYTGVTPPKKMADSSKVAQLMEKFNASTKSQVVVDKPPPGGWTEADKVPPTKPKTIVANPSWAYGPSGKIRNVVMMKLPKVEDELYSASGFEGSQWHDMLLARYQALTGKTHPSAMKAAAPDPKSFIDPAWAFGPHGKMRNVGAMGLQKVKNELFLAAPYKNSEWYKKLATRHKALTGQEP